jgi:nucleoid DNA-binding protein
MNKKELITATCAALSEADIRKEVAIKAEKFRITSESGDSAVFTVDRKAKRLYYNAHDVGNILDAMIAVVEDRISKGEPVGVRGFGQIEVRKTKEHRVREPDQEIWHTIPAGYKPKFTAGCNLSQAARAYGLQEEDIGAEQFLSEPDMEEDE